MGLKCIIRECNDDAAGLVCVNLHEPEITVFMIPACVGHGEVLKTNQFFIQLNINEPPVVDVGTADQVDLTLRFEPFNG